MASPAVSQEEDPEKYEKHFAAYVGEGIEGDDLEDLYKGVRDPCLKPVPNPTPSCERVTMRGALLVA